MLIKKSLIYFSFLAVSLPSSVIADDDNWMLDFDQKDIAKYYRSEYPDQTFYIYGVNVFGNPKLVQKLLYYKKIAERDNGMAYYMFDHSAKAIVAATPIPWNSIGLQKKVAPPTKWISFKGWVS
ncbi:uncharacterized protein PgNI_04060 [Pyricularia grisea]|uniref:Uncharacterized protein n=1 Tax=Pyricularia grisea TaxID=148305 RepID=A0A6P8BC68_PYRGI|nr:uncharacterized protein PgNI_04060 [Pyricularia grisea]TLD13282.1 hypothetical protein PgNI_04060 [Pyricularia grisea]